MGDDRFFKSFVYIAVPLLMVMNAWLFIQMRQFKEDVRLMIEGEILAAGSPAPALILPDAAGNHTDLRSLIGEPILVAFSKQTPPEAFQMKLGDFAARYKHMIVLLVVEAEAPQIPGVLILKGGEADRKRWRVPKEPWLYLVDRDGHLDSAGDQELLDRLTALEEQKTTQ
ncbi:MAG: hypothetical protein QNK37_21670 [Acidobacteriota bacterium]|nr:hypothetical protein [Acidobacteriota bacterium]